VGPPSHAGLSDIFLLATPAIALLVWFALNPPEPDTATDVAVSVQVVETPLPGPSVSPDLYLMLVDATNVLAFIATVLAVVNAVFVLRSWPAEAADGPPR
jgi:hypothetical protein